MILGHEVFLFGAEHKLRKWFWWFWRIKKEHQNDLSWETLFQGKKSDLFMRRVMKRKDCKFELGTLRLTFL